MLTASQAAPAAVQASSAADGRLLHFDEAAFGVFYNLTARPLWAYLVAAGGDHALADDLTQEAFIRLLRADFQPESDEHLRRYLFRIATNLLHDRRRADRRLSPLSEALAGSAPAPDTGAHTDVRRMLGRLKPRERQLLWLAHVEGRNHEEIAGVTGTRPESVRVLLFRARRRLAGLLRAAGLGPTGAGEKP